MQQKVFYYTNSSIINIQNSINEFIIYSRNDIKITNIALTTDNDGHYHALVTCEIN